MAKKAKKNEKYGDVRESAHRIWLAGLGALAKAEEEGTKLFHTLVEKGEEFEDRGKQQFKLVKGKAVEAKDYVESTFDKLGDRFDDKVGKAVQRLGVPTRDEIQRLTRRVEELTAKVDRIKPKSAPKATSKTARKPAAKKATRKATKKA